MAEISIGISNNDLDKIDTILRSTGFFYDYEIKVALEIAEETIVKGHEAGGYKWMKMIDHGDKLIAFACYGKNTFSTHSWDLYWIAVHEEYRNNKLGSALLKAVEDDVKLSGGRIIWIETSGRPLYMATEVFYKRNGYSLMASLNDFYGPGDPKQIYSKVL